MTAPGTKEKRCVVCGEDCSNKPRTKDPKGRYYCQECYSRAKTQHPTVPNESASKPRNVVPPPTPKVKPVAAPPRTLPDDDLGLNLLDDLIAAPPPAAVSSHQCPKCQSPMNADSVLCTNCGYNIQTHAEAQTAKVAKAPRPSTGGILWPWLIGIPSVIFGIGGLLLYGGALVLGFISALSSGAPLKFVLLGLAPFGITTGLSAWLTRDGFRILRHNSEGVKWIRFWAMTKLLLYGIILVLIANSPTAELQRRLEQSALGSSVSAQDYKTAMLLVMLWFLAWPSVVMVFFFIPRIQQDVDQWD